MNIFTRKKTLLAEIDRLNEQIRIQSREMASIRKANTDLNQLWQLAKKSANELQADLDGTAEKLRQAGIDHAAALGEKNQTIEGLLAEIASLKDANSGLASSVSDLKGKLRKDKAKINELKDTIATLRKKQTTKARPKGQSPYTYIKPPTNEPTNPLDL